MAEFTHFDSEGNAHMVDVGSKPATARRAVVKGHVKMDPATLKMICDGTAKKGSGGTQWPLSLGTFKSRHQDVITPLPVNNGVALEDSFTMKACLLESPTATNIWRKNTRYKFLHF